MEEYGFDGVSFDYEYPYTRKSNQIYGNFLEKLKAAMPEGKKLSAALSLWNISGFNGFPVKKLDCLDSIERGNHSAFYEMCANAIYQLKSKGVDMSKVHLGLPFYSRPADKAAYWGDYAQASKKLGKWGNSLVEEINVDGKVYQQVCYYNGRQMIYDKTCYALDIGLGGVLFGLCTER